MRKKFSICILVLILLFNITNFAGIFNKPFNPDYSIDYAVQPLCNLEDQD